MLCSFVGMLPVHAEMRGSNTSTAYGIKDNSFNTIEELKEKGMDIHQAYSAAAGYQIELLKQLDRKSIRFDICEKKRPAME